MARRAQEEREEPDLTNMVFRNGADRHRQEQLYRRFHQRGILPTRYIDEDCLRDLGLLESVQFMLHESGLHYIATMNLPTYESLTLEFLISFSYQTPSTPEASQYLIGATTFRLFNMEYTMNQETLSQILHCNHGEGVEYRIPPEEDWKARSFEIWECLTNTQVNDWAELLSTHIHNPCILYFHRVLVNTVFGRANNNKVNAREMYFLHCTQQQKCHKQQ